MEGSNRTKSFLFERKSLMENKITERMKKIPEDKRAEVLAKLQKCENKEAILALAAEYGVPVTDELAEAAEKLLKSPKILNENDLSLIAGGTFNGGGSIPNANYSEGDGSGIC